MNNEETIIIRAYQEGINIVKIGKITGINNKVISETLKRNNIPVKEFKKPIKNSCDNNFFSNYTKESCYWAGFILADGNLEKKLKRIHIKLSEKDKEHLLKFARAIKFTGPLYDDFRKEGYRLVQICVSSKQIYEDLENKFDITPAKSLTAKFSPKIPKEFYSDFIRGYFDGDGTICKSKQHISAQIGFIGTQQVCEKIINIFNEILNIPIKSVSKERNIFQVGYYGKKARPIMDWLYLESTKQTRLDRKYEKYLDCIQNKTL